MAAPAGFISHLLFRSLSRSSFVLFGLVAAITISCAAYDAILINVDRTISEEVEKDVKRFSEQFPELVSLRKDVELDIVQIQQFLQDYAATRGLDGLDNGLEEAEKFANKFHADVKAASALAGSLEATELVASFANVEKAFPEFYSSGVQVAKTYAAQGPAAGNKTMSHFDDLCDKLQQAVNGMSAALKRMKAKSDAELSERMRTLSDLRQRQLNVAIGSVVIIALTSLFAVISVRR
jgi:methyl-accepting chemotaxis protein